MYKFVTIEGSCGSPYDIRVCEASANKMVEQGFELVHVYQTSTAACIGQSKSVLVMVFKKV